MMGVYCGLDVANADALRHFESVSSAAPATVHLANQSDLHQNGPELIVVIIIMPPFIQPYRYVEERDLRQAEQPVDSRCQKCNA